MWQNYRSTLVPLQLFIVTACVTIFFMTRQWPVVLGVAAIMELGSLAGAAWAARSKRKTESARDVLPLRPRK